MSAPIVQQPANNEVSSWCLRFSHDLPTALQTLTIPGFDVEVIEPVSRQRDTNISGWSIAIQVVLPPPHSTQIFGGIASVQQGVARVDPVHLLELFRSHNINQPPPSFHISAHVHHPSAANSVVMRAVSGTIHFVSSDGYSNSEVPPPTQPAFGLRFVEPLESVWYADRHFPQFEVELFDLETQEPVMARTDMKVAVGVVDGFGRDASDKVREQITHHKFAMVGCRATICGLRFTAVSSKSGGFFRICTDLVEPDRAIPLVRGVMSDKIQVLSYRLYHNPKVTLEKLAPGDPLNKMPGIGNLYAKRFGMLGVNCVMDLARVDIAGMGPDKSHKLLDHLRKERGGLNLFKLGELVNKARDVVHRYNQAEAESSLQVLDRSSQQFMSSMNASNSHPHTSQYNPNQAQFPQHHHPQAVETEVLQTPPLPSRSDWCDDSINKPNHRLDTTTHTHSTTITPDVTQPKTMNGNVNVNGHHEGGSREGGLIRLNSFNRASAQLKDEDYLPAQRSVKRVRSFTMSQTDLGIFDE